MAIEHAEPPIYLGRRVSTQQNTYEDDIVEEVTRLFGVGTVEYGLVTAGSTKLVGLLQKHVWSFGAEEIITIADDPEKGAKIIADARRVGEIRDLIFTINKRYHSAKEPSWFEPGNTGM